MNYRPILRIAQYFENSTLLSEVEALFTHCCQCPTWTNSQFGTFDGRMSATRGLIPLLSALRLDALSLEMSGLIPDIGRCLFVMPMLTPDGFKHLLDENDEASLVIALYYWTAVWRLASGKSWWMRERAVYMSKKLLGQLRCRCEECTAWAAELRDGDWSYRLLRLELHCFSGATNCSWNGNGIFLWRCEMSDFRCSNPPGTEKSYVLWCSELHKIRRLSNRESMSGRLYPIQEYDEHAKKGKTLVPDPEVRRTSQKGEKSFDSSSKSPFSQFKIGIN